LSGLGELAVVGGVGLAGDEEDLADSDVRDLKQCDGIAPVEGAEFDGIEAAGRSGDCGVEFACGFVDRYPEPLA
jgi:hypothetical protein